MQTIISSKYLKDHPEIVIIDCRFSLQDPTLGEKQYETAHIPGAYYADLEKDLSSPKKEHGGRHPLPNIEQFAKKLGQFGVTTNTPVVAYDEKNGDMAARLWWLLRYLGHDNVAVLNGGIQAWLKEGYPTESGKNNPQNNQTFTPNRRTDWVVHLDTIQNRSQDSALIDSRAPERYTGTFEPIDPKAGHIPGAILNFWADGVDESGFWKPSNVQYDRFAKIADKEHIYVYCGSGVTACANLLALHLAGIDHAKLYAGSFSDWASYDLPVATKEESKA